MYDYVVINLTYSSCRMASNRLTRGQVETIFKKGKVLSSFEPLKVSDLIETLNHCMCVDYVLDHIQEPLTQKFIQNLHYMLMIGTVDERKERVTPGEYRTDRMKPRNRRLLPAKKINSSLGELLREYEARKRVDRSIILDFHVRFEQIFPFEDGNGRVGRLIMFKECLRYDVMPFILDSCKVLDPTLIIQDKRHHIISNGQNKTPESPAAACQENQFQSGRTAPGIRS